MMWKTKTLQKHNFILSKRFKLLFNRILRLNELKLRKQYHQKFNNLIIKTINKLEND